MGIAQFSPLARCSETPRVPFASPARKAPPAFEKAVAYGSYQGESALELIHLA